VSEPLPATPARSSVNPEGRPEGQADVAAAIDAKSAENSELILDLDLGESHDRSDGESALGGLSDFAADLDEADAVSEADIYLAYGRYAEAEELLKREIKRSPDRLDVRFKLAEVYAGAGNSEGVRKVLHWLKGAGAEETDPVRWSHLLEMAQTVEQGEVWDPEATPMPESPVMSSAGEAPTVPGGEFDLAALDLSAELPAELFGEEDRDLPSLEGLFGHDDGTVPAPPPLTEPARAAPPPLAEETDTPVLLDDLVLEDPLLGLDAPAAGPSLAPPNLDETSDVLLTLDDIRDSQGIGLDALLEMPEQRVPPLAESTARSGGTETPLRGRDEVVGPLIDSADLDLRLPEASARVGEEASGPEWPLDPGIWDENATKLDLARAYIDMDDVASARDILAEVVADGSEDQRKEAETLLRTVG
jgi:pilus assembly protein FimV